MPAQQAENSLKAILGDTARAHHDAFAATDGDDPDWPLWYAANLKPLLREFLAAEMTQSRLVHCLVALDDEHAAEMSDEPWPSFYAIRLIERYGTAAAPATDVLALYYFERCPYCRRVLGAIDELGLDVELRDILQHDDQRAALVKGTGRSTVPVLHITSAEGGFRWMPESADIVAYLHATYGASLVSASA
jgi:glutaredoxin